MALGAVPFAVAPELSTVFLWVLAVIILVVGDALLAASPRAVAVSRSLPATVRMGSSVSSELRLTNLNGRKLRGTVRDAWQPTAGPRADRHPVLIPGDETRRCVTRLTPMRRGDLSADLVTIRSFGPLGIGGRQASIPVAGHLRVLPKFRARRHLPSKLKLLRELDGAASVQVRGQGTEFDSLREYVPGDDVRSIDWRATARSAEVVVRTWRPERDRRVLIIVDSSRNSAARVGEETRLDASIESALLLGALASKAGDRVGLIALDRVLRARVPLNSRGDVLANFAETLAPVEPRLVEMDWPLIAELTSSQLSQRSLVVLLTTLDSASVESGLLPVASQIARAHQVIIASVTDPELEELRQRRDNIADIFTAGAVERGQLERFSMGRILSRAGIEIVEASPDELAAKLADSYLALKAAGRL